MEHKQFYVNRNNEDTQNVQSDFELRSSNTLRTAKNLFVKEVFSVTETEVSHFSGQRLGRTAVRGAITTISSSDFLIGVTALAVATSIGLPKPSIVGVGKTYIIKDEVGGANTTNITIRSEGEKTIDGASSTTLNTAYQSKRFYSDGSNWFTC